MKTIQNVLIGISLLFCGGLMSCTDDTETTDVQQSVKPGLYSIDITLTAESGVKSETRGLDTENGEFTNEYPYEYIYIHSAKTDDTHQSIRIPLENVEHCDGCQGIHMQVEVEDKNNGGGYIIRAGEKEMTLSADDKVYFSTIEGPYWEAETSGATPVSGSDVFVQNDEINKELLKSQPYTKDELVKLMQQEIPTIKMTRHVTGFRVYFMFTHVTADGSTDNVIKEEEWLTELGNPTDFSIKLYLGPNFCHQYDVLNNEVAFDDVGGYYATTNDQTYQPFKQVKYAYSTGSGGIGTYEGFGYVTDVSNYLLSPLNTSIPATDFSIYAFIKYKSSNDSSDEGASWFQAQIPGITLEPNRIHYIIMAFDIEDLRSQFLTDTNTLSRTPWSAPRKIDIKPIKVICN